ncbi:MAG: hypothetical protein ACRDRQ_27015, partial [Pseudonocardiaceae bacterium]
MSTRMRISIAALGPRPPALTPQLSTASHGLPRSPSRWLFPGRRAGQPMNPVTFQQRLRRIGIPGVNGRTGAIRQL